MFEHGILRRILGPVVDDETGQWRRRHNAELRDLTGLPPITSYVRSQRLRWAGQVARMDDASLPRRHKIERLRDGIKAENTAR